MQRNQWPLRYKASEVRKACLRREDELREQVLDLKHRAAVVVQNSAEYCQSCGQPKHDDAARLRRHSQDPLRDAKTVEAKADEYGKWAQALATRGEDTLALHFDDAEYFGLLVEDAEGMGLTGDPKGEKLASRLRRSALGEGS